MSNQQNDPMAKLVELNTALKASKARAEGSRAQREEETAHGTSGHGAAEGGAARQSERNAAHSLHPFTRDDQDADI